MDIPEFRYIEFPDEIYENYETVIGNLLMLLEEIVNENRKDFALHPTVVITNILGGALGNYILLKTEKGETRDRLFEQCAHQLKGIYAAGQREEAEESGSS